MNFTPKIKAKLYGENFRGASEQEIIEEINEWKTLQVSLFWEKLREIKKELLTQNRELDFSHFIFPNFEEKSSKSFNFWEREEKQSFTTDVLFHKAHFIGQTNFSSVQFHKESDFSNATFHQDSNFNHATFAKNTTFKKAKFVDEALFYNVEFQKNVCFNESGFHGRTVFHECKFHSVTSFSLVSSKYRITFFSCFAKRITLKYSRVNHAYFVKNNFEYLDLHGIAIETPFFSDNRVKDAERETFAYIKHFFDNGNDYISANYYYAKEMRAYQRQLFPKSNAPLFKKLYHWFNQPNLSDKLVFGFSKIASNFGQNIFLPLYWILFAGMLFVGLKSEHNLLFIGYSFAILSLFIMSTTLFRKLLKMKKREDLVWLLSQTVISFFIVGYGLYGGEFIGDFAKVINPVKMIRGDSSYCQGIELSCLLLRIFIATMVYHFVIASKRGVRR